ncbi:MAG: hypothetical protein ABSG51_16865 [Terracidiphilus sp.]|jgi:hypothetical protein
MRFWAILLLFAGIALAAHAAKKVTVAQFEQTLSAAHGKRDAELAKKLGEMELTERLSDARLSQLELQMPGVLSRQALVAAADASVFLKVRDSDVSSKPAPEPGDRDSMLAMVFDYVRRTIPQLPNFFAARETTRFEETPALAHRDASTWSIAIPLHFVGKSSDTVLYRNGAEVVEPNGPGERTFNQSIYGLEIYGAFGPILPTVLSDASHGTLTWGRWEQAPEGLRAVFQFSVPEAASHYKVTSLNWGHEGLPNPPYHGEIEVDPADGTILRLSMVAELKPSDPVSEAGIIVEYGPVQIGGKTYFCPLKSVARSVVRTVRGDSAKKSDAPNVMLAPGSTVGLLDIQKKDEDASLEPAQLRVNDVAFKQYHLFRAETRILTDNDGRPGENQDSGAVPAATPQH